MASLTRPVTGPITGPLTALITAAPIEGGTGVTLAAPQDFAFLDDEVNPPTFAANFVTEGAGAIEVDDYAQLEVDDGSTTTVHDSEAYDQDFIDGIDTSLSFPTLTELDPGSYTFRLRNARDDQGTADVVSSWAGPIGPFEVPESGFIGAATYQLLFAA